MSKQVDTGVEWKMQIDTTQGGGWVETTTVTVNVGDKQKWKPGVWSSFTSGDLKQLCDFMS